jgi:hypothetical protein
MSLKNIGTQIKNVPDGVYIYCSELSRLGCNMSDILNFINYCNAKNITVIQCKDGSQIENNTIAGKALIFALTLAAEIELENIRNRTRARVKAYIENGGKLGRANEKWGKGNTPEQLKINLENGHVKKARVKNYNYVHSEEVNKFCNILHLVREEFVPNNKEGSLFYEDWHKIKVRMNSEDYLKILSLHNNFYRDDKIMSYKDAVNKYIAIKRALKLYEKNKTKNND